MAPPHKQIAPGTSGRDVKMVQVDRLASIERDNKATTTATQLVELTETLTIVADWREDLTRRMMRGQLIFETIGLSTGRHDEVIAEARAFIAVCDVLAMQMPGAVVEVDHDERAAA